MKTAPPFCKTAPKWIEGHLGKGCFAPMTCQDYRAFSAFVHLLELYSFADEDGQQCALIAMSSTIMAMQPKCRSIAKKAIPHVLDWDDEDRLWARMGMSS